MLVGGGFVFSGLRTLSASGMHGAWVGDVGRSGCCEGAVGGVGRAAVMVDGDGSWGGKEGGGGFLVDAVALCVDLFVVKREGVR